MTPRFRSTLAAPLAVLLLAACTERRAGAAPDAAPDGAPAPTAPAWAVNPAQGVTLAAAGDTLLVETGPHVVLWPQGAEPLTPPYTVRATLRKRAGRLHEGVGLIFGASGLEGAESSQVYSYFLVRGDGSFLVKRRQGADLPVVRDWTRHPAIRRDDEAGSHPNALAVEVGEAEVRFLVNGAEVARVPAGDLSVNGAAGLRVAHDVHVAAAGFAAAPGVPADTAGGAP